jgi:hypothetical protein
LALRQLEALIALVSPSYEALQNLCTVASASTLPGFSDKCKTLIGTACSSFGSSVASERTSFLLQLDPAVARQSSTEESLMHSLGNAASWMEAVALVALAKQRGVALSPEIYVETLRTALRLGSHSHLAVSLAASCVTDNNAPLSLVFCELSCQLLLHGRAAHDQVVNFDKWCFLASEVGVSPDSVSAVFAAAASIVGPVLNLGFPGLPVQGAAKLFGLTCKALLNLPTRRAAVPEITVMVDWLEVAAPILPCPHLPSLVADAAAVLAVSNQPCDAVVTKLLFVVRRCSLDAQLQTLRKLAPLFSAPAPRWLAVGSLAEADGVDVSSFLHKYVALQTGIGLGSVGSVVVDVVSGCCDTSTGVANWTGALHVVLNALPTVHEDLTPALGVAVELMQAAGVLHNVIAATNLEHFAAYPRAVCVDARVLCCAAGSLARSGRWSEALKLVEQCDNPSIPTTLKQKLRLFCGRNVS